MTLFNPVFNRQTPKGLNRLKTQADEGLTTADEAGYVVLRQPPASKLANLFRIDVRDHALGFVTQQLGGRVTEHPPAGWLGPRTPSLREGPGSASVPSGSPDPAAGAGARGAALRSWQAGAVQFTAKICGLVGRATMADPLSAGGAFSSLSARCFFSGAVGCPLSSGQSIRVPSCDPASQANVVAVVRGEARRFAGSCRFRGYQGPIPEPIQSVRPHVGKVLLPGCSGDREKDVLT